MLQISQNTRERVEHIVTMCTQSFRVLMACMLSMFVYQVCGEKEKMCDRWHMLEDNYEYVVVLNFVSLLNFLILYISETFRQCFLIRHLDVVKNLPDDNLKNALVVKPQLRDDLIKINKRHLLIVISNVFFYVINVVTSSIVIVNRYYGGTKTLMGIATNVLLVSSKLGEDLYIMYECMTTDMIGLSTTIMEPVSYNCLDTDEIIV